MRPPSVLRDALFYAAFAMAFRVPAMAQDSLTVASTSGNAEDTVSVAVSLRDANGTLLGTDAGAGRRIQALVFRVSFDPTAVTSIAFVRAGVLQTLTPLYERAAITPGAIGYIASFAEATSPIAFTADAPAPGDRIGTLRVQLSPSLTQGANVLLTLDPLITTLSNQEGTTRESRFQHNLNVNSGSITIGGSSTTTTVMSSVNPSATGQSVTFTAVVMSAAPGAIGGTVTFFDGTQPIASANVENGEASFTTASLAEGTYRIKAAFEGDATHAPSESAFLLQSVSTNPALAGPASVTANADTDSSVMVSWSPVGDATSYEVFRSANGNAFTSAGTTATTSLNDGGVAPDTTYLYVVRSVNVQGSSGSSQLDPATTIIFSDDPVASAMTRVKAAHVLELRSAVNAFRRTAGLGTFAFSDPSLMQDSTSIRKLHLDQLRSALLAARAMVGLSTPPFTDPTLTAGSTPIRAAHVDEIRRAVK